VHVRRAAVLRGRVRLHGVCPRQAQRGRGSRALTPLDGVCAWSQRRGCIALHRASRVHAAPQLCAATARCATCARTCVRKRACAHAGDVVFPCLASEISRPPFEVTETGWGEFEVGIQIHFHDPSQPPVSVVHLLKLHPSPNTQVSLHKVRDEGCPLPPIHQCVRVVMLGCPARMTRAVVCCGLLVVC
jgi:hypothetical protein